MSNQNTWEDFLNVIWPLAVCMLGRGRNDEQVAIIANELCAAMVSACARLVAGHDDGEERKRILATLKEELEICTDWYVKHREEELTRDSNVLHFPSGYKMPAKK
jgi:hypothetical protein